MDELRQAYETLGLPEDAIREQVEQRYFLLLKKARSRKQRQGAETEDSPDLEAVNLAYTRIIGHESEKAVTVPKQGKAAHFFHYYKWHLIIGVIALILVVTAVKGVVDRRAEEANKPPLDVSATVFGNFFGTDADKLSQNLLGEFPEWKRIDVSLTAIPKELRSQQDMALQQKAMLTLMTEKTDLFILDESNFSVLAKQHLFMPLDGLPFWADLKKDQQRIRTALTDQDTAAHPYGVDITGNPIFTGTNVEAMGERQIIAVRYQAPDKDKALRVLKALTLGK
ncbi:hypothetical protein E5161_09230 [Cohnella pontilimi]|uniref:Uncharacterized protein n=1 Tax=Cohnella pontilimi TaxID=2564100 RepID=A0A4U0FBU7_9BACL|nr:hypothetical protein [Cohnella pontilimi]TJY42181.1 hypothetical protein E5161_09230 [Cohnella pontilimi]